MNDPHAQLDEILAICVELVTGDPHAQPRPGQVAMAHDILTAMLGDPRGHRAQIGPVGVGKTFAHLAAAMLVFARTGQRTLISTQSKALQEQILRKDAPVVAEAVARIAGTRPVATILKGFADYACTVATCAAAGEVIESVAAEHPRLRAALDTPEHPAPAAVGLEAFRGESTPPVGSGAPGPQEEDGGYHAVVSRALTGVLAVAAYLDTHRGAAGATVTVAGREAGLADMTGLLTWVLPAAAAGGAADRSEYPGTAAAAWDAVSTPATECIGATCPAWRMCPAIESRRAVGDAGIVVTNHAVLAVQASKGARAALGNASYGDFHHLVVDEGHALPAVVRSAGAIDVDAARIAGAVRVVERHFAGSGIAAADRLIASGRCLATHLDSALSATLAHAERHATTVAWPAGATGAAVDDALRGAASWAKDVLAIVPGPESLDSVGAAVAARKVRARFTSLASDAAQLVSAAPGLARWIARADQRRKTGSFTGACAHGSPVDVASAVRERLYVAEPAASQGPQIELSVAVMSATMPASIVTDLALRARLTEYPSPFDVAYANSLLYVPRVTGEDELARCAIRRGDRWMLDTRAHMTWCVDQIVSLVAANQGSALILAATNEGGMYYANALRGAAHGYDVLTQWDGRDISWIIQAWRDDPGAVLVGTRSLMTGVDAPGETNTLVIADRPPRAAMNVVDDARRDLLAARAGLDKWAADRAVYVADAAVYLEQCAGRLIRSATDSGTFACLDPRLNTQSPLTYPAPTRSAYMAALRKFTQRTSFLDHATAWISARRAAA